MLSFHVSYCCSQCTPISILSREIEAQSFDPHFLSRARCMFDALARDHYIWLYPGNSHLYTLFNMSSQPGNINLRIAPPFFPLITCPVCRRAKVHTFVSTAHETLRQRFYKCPFTSVTTSFLTPLCSSHSFDSIIFFHPKLI
jgi:hypothetical protein